MVGLLRFELRKCLVLSKVLCRLAIDPKLMAEGKGLEPLAVLPVTVFGTARPAYSPAFHRNLHLTTYGRRQRNDIQLCGVIVISYKVVNDSAAIDRPGRPKARGSR